MCVLIVQAMTDFAHASQGSQNCYNQLSKCYDTAGPTGHKGCSKWEQYCGAVQNECKSGNFHGPPSVTPYLPAKLPLLSDKEYEDTSGGSSGGDSGSSTTPNSSSQGNNPPQSSTKQSENGSIDQCGGSSGLICKTGLCCSSHG